MGLAIKHEKGRFSPILVCDSCGEEIEDWSKAVVTFRPGKVGQISEAQVYHKVRCDPSDGYWEGLKRYVAGLLNGIT